MQREPVIWRSPLPDDGRARGFAEWVRELQGQNGVYLIRDASGEVLYIGESHTARLYHTLTRHLQNWNGFGSGPSFRPEYVEVGVILVEPEEAIYLQYALIQQYRPPYNEKDGRSLFLSVTIDEDEDIPF
jgi:excinuclease UvrABC nuclease subunit